jgi:hypothetical protein
MITKEIQVDSNIKTHHLDNEKILLLSENCNPGVIVDNGLGRIYGMGHGNSEYSTHYNT